MSDISNVWHYGLMAERWAEFNTEAPEAPFFLREIARHGQPALDLACGTGRLLLPLLQAGIIIHGCDVSADMLEQCQRRATGMGLRPQLFNQPMHVLDLPHRYKTIYICGSFGLAGSRDKDLETLRRCHLHLDEGGALILNIQAEYASREAWELWLREKREALPQPWPEDVQGRLASDGSEHFARFRIVSIDPLEQSCVRQVRLEKRKSGKSIASEEYTLQGNMYFKNELLLMLQIAGFGRITVNGNYTDEPATSEHEEIVFIAIK
jgi:SAM-dependent methyltransferase